MNDVEQILMQAFSYHQAGDLIEARELYLQALAIVPNHPDAIHMLGNLCLQQGDAQSAIELLSKAVSIAPHVSVFHENLGVALRTAGDSESALISFRNAVQLQPEQHSAFNNLGSALYDLQEFDESIEAYRQAVSLFPDDAEYHYNLGLAFSKRLQFSDAENAYRTALQLAPNSSRAIESLASCLQDSGQTDAAIEFLESVSPYREAQLLLATSLVDSGQHQRALSILEQLLSQNKDDSEVRSARALVLLYQGDLQAGWEEYKARKLVVPRSFPEPEWRGVSIQDQSIIVYAEQGIGEEVMFASCISDLIKDAGKCIVECDARLIPIYECTFPTADLLPRTPATVDVSSTPRADFHVALGDLPSFYRNSVDQFPNEASYLFLDPSLRNRWQERVDALGDGLKIGISWKGGKIPRIKVRKSTDLMDWHQILQAPNVHFVNLQHGDCRQEITDCERLGFPLHDFPDVDPLQELNEWAALLASLDLVISTTSATVHMAGALGVPVWTLLPEPAEWRWGASGESSHWYRSMRLFRQNQPSDWHTVLEAVANELRLVTENGGLLRK